MVKKTNKKLRGGMVRSGSVQHFRRGKSKSVLKRKSKKFVKRLRLKKH